MIGFLVRYVSMTGRSDPKKAAGSALSLVLSPLISVAWGDVATWAAMGV
jgi:hypothetical protein